MAHPHQPYWLWTGSVSFAATAALVGAAIKFDPAGNHSSFWTSDITIFAYVTFVFTIVCFACAIREVSFPLARSRSQSRSLNQGNATGSAIDRSSLSLTSNGAMQPIGDPNSADGQFFVPDTPKDLITVFKTHTSAQAQKLLEPYHDQWMRVTGALGDVGEWTGYHSRVVFQSSPREPVIVMIFRNKNVFDKRLSILRAGVRMTVIGQIERIDSTRVQITNCEIESIGGRA